MVRRTYARRYAQAVFEIAQKSSQLESWQTDLRKIVDTVTDAALAAFLESPKVHFKEKEQVLSERLAMVSPLSLNLVRLLIVRGRLEIVGEIADEYQRLLDSYHGIEQAELTTAVPLNNGEEREITRHLEEIVGKKLVVRSKVNSGLIGGMIARVSGKLLDGSTRSNLEALKREMAGANK